MLDQIPNLLLPVPCAGAFPGLIRPKLLRLNGPGSCFPAVRSEAENGLPYNTNTYYGHKFVGRIGKKGVND